MCVCVCLHACTTVKDPHLNFPPPKLWFVVVEEHSVFGFHQIKLVCIGVVARVTTAAVANVGVVTKIIVIIIVVVIIVIIVIMSPRVLMKTKPSQKEKQPQWKRHRVNQQQHSDGQQRNVVRVIWARHLWIFCKHVAAVTDANAVDQLQGLHRQSFVGEQQEEFESAKKAESSAQCFQRLLPALRVAVIIIIIIVIVAIMVIVNVARALFIRTGIINLNQMAHQRKLVC